MRGIRGFSSMSWCGIINGCLVVVGFVSEVVGVDSGGMLYWGLRVCRRITSLLIWRIVRSTGFLGWLGPGFWYCPNLSWGRVYLLLGIHHNLAWNGVFRNNQRWWLQIMLWVRVRGRWCRRVLCVHGFFHLFVIKNLGALVSIVSILTT